MKRNTALVIGLGIAGMSAARGLERAGWDVTVIERARARRTGGYFLGFYDEGAAAARSLGVFDHIHQRTVERTATWEVDEHGGRKRGIGFIEQREKPSGLLRGDVEAGLWAAVEGTVEVRFGTIPTAIINDPARATVQIQDVATSEVTEETYDLVVGADGIRSSVRSLAFGPHERYLRAMNTMICVFQMTEQVPGFSDKHSVQVFDGGRAFWTFPMQDMPPTALFTYRTRRVSEQFDRSPVDIITARFAGLSGAGAIEHGLHELRAAPDMLFDSVQQTRMRSWHTGRVALVGDSAWCMTLFSGMGATAGMLGGDELGRAVTSNPGDLNAALEQYETRMRPYIRKGQRTAALKGQGFVPQNRAVNALRRRLVTSGVQQLRLTPGYADEATRSATGAPEGRTV